MAVESTDVFEALEALPAGVEMPAALSDELDTLLRGAKEYQLRSLSPSTIAAYRVNWGEYLRFCERVGVSALPSDVETVQRYLTWCADYRHVQLQQEEDERERQYAQLQAAGIPLPASALTKAGRRRARRPIRPLKLSGIEQRLATIATVHRLNNQPSPTTAKAIEMTMDGIIAAYRTTRGSQPKRATVAEDIRLMVGRLGESLIDVRDRALILLGFVGGMRRSELVAMTAENVVIEREGLVYTLLTSKTNRLGRKGPQRKALRYHLDPRLCPVRAYQTWVTRAGITEGPILRNLARGQIGPALSDRSVHLVLRRRVTDGLCDWLSINCKDDAEIDRRLRKNGRWVRSRFTPETLAWLFGTYDIPITLDPRRVGGHSLRSGMVTTARANGVNDHAIQEVTGHESNRMLDRYTHPRTIWSNNPTGDLL